MTPAAIRIVLSTLITITLPGAAMLPRAAPSGINGGCIQDCNLLHAECQEYSIAACEATYSRESVEFTLCVEEFLHFCNRLAFDCKYNHCWRGLPEPLQPAPEATAGPAPAAGDQEVRRSQGK